MTRIAGLLALILAVFASLDARAQDVEPTTVEGIIQRIQPRGLFVGMDDPPFAVGDTLRITIAENADSVRVSGVTSSSLLLAWLREPIPSELGQRVLLTGQVKRETETPPVEAVIAERESVLERPASFSAGSTLRQGPRISGSYSASLTASYSDIRGRFNDLRSTARTWATPSSSVRLRVDDLPGKLHFSLNARGVRTTGSRFLAGNQTQVQLFGLALSRGTAKDRWQGTMGRFRESNSPSGGYWDGARSHLNLGAFRVGFAAGFEPERYSEAWATDTRKALIFAEWNQARTGRSQSWSVAYGLVDSDSLGSPYQYATLRQRTRLGKLRVNADAQLDRDPMDGSWSLGRWNARVTVPLSDRVTLGGRAGVRRYYAYWLDRPSFSNERARNAVDLTYRWARHSLGVSAGISEYRGGARSTNLSLSAASQPRWLPFRISQNVSLWDRALGSTLYANTRLERTGKRMTYGLDYGLLAVDQLGPVELSHIGGLFARFNTDRWGYFSVRQRLHLGASVLSSTTYFGYGIRF